MNVWEGAESRKTHKPGDLPKVVIKVTFGGNGELIFYESFSIPNFLSVRDFYL